MYLVTGGGGFIGSHVVRTLVQRGDRVRVLDNGFSGSRQRISDILTDVEWVDGDVRDEQTLERVCQDVEVVFHLAAIASVPRSVSEPELSHATNLTGTLNILSAAQRANVRRVVFASSSAVYGNLPGSPKSETMAVCPLSPYAVHKLAGEHYCRVWYELHGLETVALRYFNVFGPSQDPQSEYAAVIPKFVTASQEGRRLTVFGDGKQSRDFIYVGNVVDANLHAAMSPKAAGKVINVGTGISVSLNQLITELEGMIGHDIDRMYAPERAGDVRESVADITQMTSLLNYTPKISFREGLSRTVQAFEMSMKL